MTFRGRARVLIKLNGSGVEKTNNASFLAISGCGTYRRVFAVYKGQEVLFLHWSRVRSLICRYICHCACQLNWKDRAITRIGLRFTEVIFDSETKLDSAEESLSGRIIYREWGKVWLFWLVLNDIERFFSLLQEWRAKLILVFVLKSTQELGIDCNKLGTLLNSRKKNSWEMSI